MADSNADASGGATAPGARSGKHRRGHDGSGGFGRPAIAAEQGGAGEGGSQAEPKEGAKVAQKTQIIQFTPSQLEEAASAKDGPPPPKPPKPNRPAGVAKTALMASATEEKADAVREATPMPRRPSGPASVGGPRVFTGLGQEDLANAAQKARGDRQLRRRELVTEVLERAAVSPEVIEKIETGFTKAFEDLEHQLAQLEKENAKLVLEAEELRREVKALKALSDDDGPGEKRYTEAELKSNLAGMEKACREEAEKALTKTAELAKEKINRWKAEAKRLQALLAENGITPAAASSED